MLTFFFYFNTAKEPPFGDPFVVIGTILIVAENVGSVENQWG